MDLTILQSDFYAYSVLYNILYGHPPFAPSTKLLLAVVAGLQSGNNKSVLPVNIQAQVVKILDGFRNRLSRADTIVRPTSHTPLLAPLLSGTAPTVPALMARAPAVSSDSARRGVARTSVLTKTDVRRSQTT